MQDAVEAQLIQTVNIMAESVGELRALAGEISRDVAEVKTHLATQNGRLGKLEKSQGAGEAWQRGHSAEHASNREDRQASADRKVEWFKAAAPYVASLPGLIVLIMVITGTLTPIQAARALDVKPIAPFIAPSVVPSATPTATVTPDMRGGGGPAFATPTAIMATSAKDRESLAALCWVETRGFLAAQRRDACLSVISTVMTRAANFTMSDGTIAGTLNHSCLPDSPACQFPAFVHNGCEGIIAELCPFNSPSELPAFRAVVRDYFEGGARGTCDGYLFYGIQDFDPPECAIRDAAGNFTHWHGRPIIEVTPVGGLPTPNAGGAIERELTDALFIPAAAMNVRKCANKSCPIVKQLAGLAPVRVYRLLELQPSGDIWLALDADTDRLWVAYNIGDTFFGTLECDGGACYP